MIIRGRVTYDAETGTWTAAPYGGWTCYAGHSYDVREALEAIAREYRNRYDDPSIEVVELAGEFGQFEILRHRTQRGIPIVRPLREEDVRRRLDAGESAVDLAVEKWERISLAAETNELTDEWIVGAPTCALCILHADEPCLGCPIRRATAKPDCENTPYYVAAAAVERLRRPRSVMRETGRSELIEKIRCQLEFLRAIQAREKGVDS